MNLIRAARETGTRYVVSSGDPIEGFFRITKGAAVGRAFGVYERLLMRHSAGFIGWTPYLTGRALELGAPRGVTIEGAVDLDIFRPLPEAERESIRRDYGLQPGHIVCGIVGSLLWTPRQNYCYGLELVEAARRLKRQDMSFLIVGDGTGRAELERRVPESMRGRVIFTGRVAEQEVTRAMNAMHIGFITQSLDELGSYRLTTKMPEYLACGFPSDQSDTRLLRLHRPGGGLGTPAVSSREHTVPRGTDRVARNRERCRDRVEAERRPPDSRGAVRLREGRQPIPRLRRVRAQPAALIPGDVLAVIAFITNVIDSRMCSSQ
jgi:hypothetical protein